MCITFLEKCSSTRKKKGYRKTVTDYGCVQCGKNPNPNIEGVGLTVVPSQDRTTPDLHVGFTFSTSL